jgi:hypothetical protein
MSDVVVVRKSDKECDSGRLTLLASWQLPNT